MTTVPPWGFETKAVFDVDLNGNTYDGATAKLRGEWIVAFFVTPAETSFNLVFYKPTLLWMALLMATVFLKVRDKPSQLRLLVQMSILVLKTRSRRPSHRSGIHIVSGLFQVPVPRIPKTNFVANLRQMSRNAVNETIKTLYLNFSLPNSAPKREIQRSAWFTLGASAESVSIYSIHPQSTEATIKLVQRFTYLVRTASTAYSSSVSSLARLYFAPWDRPM